MLDWLFGYDLFVSYSRIDWSEEYAVSLREALLQPPYRMRCFVDSFSMEGGLSWRLQGRRAIRKSGKILFIATPGTVRSKGVREELSYNLGLGTGARRKIMVVDVDGCWEEFHHCTQTYGLLCRSGLNEDSLRIPETSPDVPTSATVDRIYRDFDLRREEDRRTRIFAATAVVLGILLVTSVAFLALVVMSRKELRETNVGLRSRLAIAQSIDRVDLDSPGAVGFALRALEHKSSSAAWSQLWSSVSSLGNVRQVAGGGHSTINAIGYDSKRDRVYTVDSNRIMEARERDGLQLVWQLDLDSYIDAKRVTRTTSSQNYIVYSGPTDLIVLEEGHIVVAGPAGGLLLVDPGQDEGTLIDQKTPGTGDAAILALAACDLHHGFYAGDDAGIVRQYRINDSELEEVARVQAHAGPVFDLAPFDGGVVSGGEDGTVRSFAWDNLAADDLFIAMDPEEAIATPLPIYSLAVDQGGTRIAAGDGYGMVHVFELGTGSVVPASERTSGRVTELGFLGQGEILAAVVQNQVLQLDVDRNEWMGELPGHSRPGTASALRSQRISALCCLPNASEVLTGGEDGLLFMRKVQIRKFGEEFFGIAWPLRLHPFEDVRAILPYESELIGIDRRGRVLFLQGGALHALERESDSPVQLGGSIEIPYQGSAIFNRVSNVLAVVDGETCLTFYSTVDGSVIKQWDSAHPASLEVVVAVDAGFFSASTDGSVKYWGSDGLPVPGRHLKLPSDLSGLGAHLGGLVVAHHEGSTIELRELSAEGKVSRLEPFLHDYPVQKMYSLGTDGIVLSSTGGELLFRYRGVAEWSPRQGRGHEFGVSSLRGTGDLVVSSDGARICLWDASIPAALGVIQSSVGRQVIVEETDEVAYYLQQESALMAISLNRNEWVRRARRLKGADALDED